MIKNPGEKNKFLRNAVKENDQGDTAAYRGKQAFQAETTAKKKYGDQQQKISQLQKKEGFDTAYGKIKQ